ncbi:MAG: hypothetical protein JXL84_08855 [Deltaproteobacteria bacterium]|nr:hypothetical protein [Deltaproteobacteria bacterium]
MVDDPRNKPRLTHQDILSFNFIRSSVPFVFRRHYHSGLRSHIMEVLRVEDVERENQGIVVDSLKRFPRAIPSKMLRVFRTRFRDLREAEEELRRVKLVETFLAPEYMALSNEFLVDFIGMGTRDFLLCGLQEYVPGENLDPWSPLEGRHLLPLFHHMASGRSGPPGPDREKIWLKTLKEQALEFARRIRAMILEAGHIPDLAGVGNLIITPSGSVRLVDINNISRVSLDATITLDDRGYPVCDKSVEALSLLERGLLEIALDPGDPIYRTYLDPERMKEVKALEAEFHRSMAAQAVSTPTSFEL